MLAHCKHCISSTLVQFFAPQLSASEHEVQLQLNALRGLKHWDSVRFEALWGRLVECVFSANLASMLEIWGEKRSYKCVVDDDVIGVLFGGGDNTRSQPGEGWIDSAVSWHDVISVAARCQTRLRTRTCSNIGSLTRTCCINGWRRTDDVSRLVSMCNCSLAIMESLLLITSMTMMMHNHGIATAVQQGGATCVAWRATDADGSCIVWRTAAYSALLKQSYSSA